jgi:predicted PurR-regulated permease PerM
MPERNASEGLPQTPPLHADPPGIRYLVRLATAVVVLVTLYWASGVLIPITLAILLSLILSPLVRILQRWGLPRIAAASIALVAAIGLTLLLAGVIGTQMSDLVQELPRYETRLVSKLSSLSDATIGWANRLVGRIGSAFQAKTVPDAGASSPEPITSVAPQPANRPTGNVFSPLSFVGRIISPVLHPLAALGIVFVVTAFILLQKEELRDRSIRLFGAHRRHSATLAIDEVSHRLSHYFLIQLVINALVGLVIGTGLVVIGLPDPLVFGIVAALLRFIPYVGPIIGGTLLSALAVVIDPGWSMALWTVILFAVTEAITGQIIEPMVFRYSTGLSPFAVIIAAIFWGWLWGPVGLVLSMPLTLGLVVFGRHFEPLRFFDVMLGDRPAPTAGGQRLDARDP